MCYDDVDKIIFAWLEDLEKNQDKDRIYMPGLSGDFGWDHLKDFYNYVVKKERERNADKNTV